jgi:hypothetical protein
MTRCLCRAGLGTVFAIAACTADGPVPLTVSGTGFSDGVAHVAVIRIPTLEAVACETTSVVAGSFELDVGDILEPTVAYRVDAFVDVDGNQRCEVGIDAVTTLELPPRMMVAERLVDPSDAPAGCASFETVCAAELDR